MMKPRWSLMLKGGLLSLAVGCQSIGFGNALQREMLAQPRLIPKSGLDFDFIENEESDTHRGPELSVWLTAEIDPNVEKAMGLEGKLGDGTWIFYENHRPVPERLKQLIPIGTPVVQAEAILDAQGFDCHRTESSYADAGMLTCHAYVSDATWSRPSSWNEGHWIVVTSLYEYGKVIDIQLEVHDQSLLYRLFRPSRCNARVTKHEE